MAFESGFLVFALGMSSRGGRLGPGFFGYGCICSSFSFRYAATFDQHAPGSWTCVVHHLRSFGATFALLVAGRVSSLPGFTLFISVVSSQQVPCMDSKFLYVQSASSFKSSQQVFV